jgi:uncharacterized protein (DUF2141 family)
MKFTHSIPWLISAIFLSSCAQQTSPTGGPKDTIPPILIKSIPKNEQINYSDKTIELTFNELLTVNNPKEELIIIPDVDKKYEVQLKKNQVKITFDQPLEENTTYSLNFRESIQDITERNPVLNLKLAFSTGDYIDSLSISGNVYDLLKSIELPDATVALYQPDTFDIFAHKPIYFSKTDKEGNYEIANLKPGFYYIYAFHDRNKNLLLESKSEAFGFLAKPLYLINNLTDINIPLIRLDTRPLVLTSARPSGTFFNIKTSKNIAHYAVTAIDSTTIYTCYGEDHANIRIYNSISDRDSILVHFNARDSIQQHIDTTLWLKFSPRRLTPEKLTASVHHLKLIGPKAVLHGQITFNKPIAHINFDSIFYSLDSATTIPIIQQDLSLDTLTNTYQITKRFDPALLTPPDPSPLDKSAISTLPKLQPRPPGQTTAPDQPHLYIGPSTFISIEADSSARMSVPAKPTTLSTTGVILVKVSQPPPHHLTQLLTRDYQLIAQNKDQASSSFHDLEPTIYQLRLVIDTDANGHWSPGNFYLHTEPEPIYFYKNEKNETTVNLKANWELGPLLITPE